MYKKFLIFLLDSVTSEVSPYIFNTFLVASVCTTAVKFLYFTMPFLLFFCGRFAWWGEIATEMKGENEKK